jgi:uncharacterized protein YabN with tetrapyrrole methylase and pyrophosphatase domain
MPSFDDVLSLVRRLRGPDGCPWDRVQTPESLLPYLLEECYEVREAILERRPQDLADELGDLVLHVAFQTVIAEEREAFDAATIFDRVLQKMVRRHPHVFGAGDAEVSRAAEGCDPAEGPHGGEVSHRSAGSHTAGLPWEEIKRIERARDGEASLLDGIPRTLPALLKAQRIQERVAEVGFDWPDRTGPLDKVREELDEVERHLGTGAGEAGLLQEEIGDLLFAVVNLARKADIVSEDALECASAKFRRRFQAVESLARQRGIHLATAGLESLDRLWDEVKLQEGTAT